MTVLETESKTDTTLQQEKVDTNVSQQKVDAKTIQQPNETTTNNPTAVKGANDEAPEDPNWKAFREARKKDRAEREAAERKAAEREAEINALKAAMEAAFSKSNAPAQSDPYHSNEETEEQKIDKIVEAKIAAREAAAERLRLEREHQEYPQRLVQHFSDFHQTISQENLDYLDYHYPEVSKPLQRLQDGFEKWSDIYRAVKKFVPNSSNARKDSARAEANFSKPKSISSPSITQPGESGGSARLTEERRAANWERMQRILKGVS